MSLEHPIEVAKLTKLTRSQFSNQFSKTVAAAKQLKLKKFDFQLQWAVIYSSHCSSKLNIYIYIYIYFNVECKKKYFNVLIVMVVSYYVRYIILMC